MRGVYLLCLFLLGLVSSHSAQGFVRGKITDDNGEEIVGAVVYLKDSNAIHTNSDLNGDYNLRIPDSKSHTLVASYVGYENVQFVIRPLVNKEVLLKDLLMRGKNEIVAIDIFAKQEKANDNYMDKKKIESATSIDVISNQTMGKTGDPNVVAAVARIPGISTSGGLITVRGIGDRYVKTTLNGLRIPTLDPLTNNIKLDLFPASLVDNVIITKTGSAELPGDWSGAYISIETKDYPDKLIVNVESQIGYNAQTTFKDFITSDRSSTDWLGFDNGLRNREHKPLVTPTLVPSTYQEMSALGLQSYYNSMGIYGWTDGSPEGTTYFKMGLVQLGLLQPASFKDDAAYNAARLQYEATYKPKAFEKINPEGTNYNNGFATNWSTFYRKAPLSFSQSFNVGNQTTFLNKQVGYILGFKYGNSYRYDPNGTSQRLGPLYQGEYPLTTSDQAQISREVAGWNALVNLAIKLNGNNSAAFMFMPNFSGTNDIQSFDNVSDGTISQEGRVSKFIFFEERKQLISQFKSEHFLPGPKIKIETGASYTKGNSIVPDFKVYEYGYTRDNVLGVTDNYLFGTSVGAGIRRFYRYLNEDVFDSKVDFDLPLDTSTLFVRKLKFGAAYQQTSRDQTLYNYVVAAGNSTALPAQQSDDVNPMLGQEQFIMNNGKVGYIYQSAASPWSNTFGNSQIRSAYVLTDYGINKLVRFSGGLRAEYSRIFSDVISYYQKGYSRDDVRRENVAGLPYANAANIQELNLLPSVNVIFKVTKIRKADLRLRVNYSKSIARPSIRELNDAGILDFEFRTLIYGNSDLKSAHITNYDFRADCYFDNGDFISASLFNKDFINHIEASFGSGGVTWNNVGRSYARGLELEGKKKFLKVFELRSNLTLVKSNSQVVRTILEVVEGKKVYTPVDTLNRTMYGQAPYIFNTVLTYKADSLGLSASLSYNTQGPRLVIAAPLTGYLDVYEMPRHVMDAKITKNLGKYFAISLTARDILNSRVRRAYKLGNEFKDYDNFRYGTNYLLSISYRVK